MATPILWGEFLVNSGIRDGVQHNVQLLALANGNFHSVWDNASSDGTSAIYAQHFYSGAVPQGDPNRINSTTEGVHSSAVVTELSDGRLVYAWTHEITVDNVTQYAIRARIFNRDGTSFDADQDGVGDGDFAVATSDAALGVPRVAALSDGRFAITYDDALGDTTDAGVKVVVYGADGLPAGTPVPVNSTQTGTQASTSLVSLGGDRFLSIYSDEGTAPDAPAVFKARVFSASGTTVTAETETTILSGATSIKENTVPTATKLSDGRLIVAWTETTLGSTNDDVKAQVFTIDAVTGALLADGSAFPVSSQQAGDQSAPAITALSKGGFAISYLETNGQGAPQVRVAIFDQNKNRIGDDTIVSNAFSQGTREHPKVIELDDGRLIVAWDEAIPDRGDDATGIRGQVLDARTEGFEWFGSEENDNRIGSVFGDRLNGLGGNDYLSGHNGDDILDGGSGHDTLHGGDGVDRMLGGSGDDVYYVDNANDVIVEHAGQGTDTVFASYSYTLSDPNLENLAAEGSAAINLTGNGLNNTITGNEAGNIINGGGGADIMRGGGGDDAYVVDNAGDMILDTWGIDTVNTSISYSLAGSAVENLKASGSSGIRLMGNELNNLITGNNGSNKLYGGFGRDVLIGGKGKDIFVFNTKPHKSLDRDKILDFNVKDDSIHLDNAVFKKLGKKGSEKKPAMLNSKFFTLGKKAKDKDDYLVYDNKKGVLYYDADGKGKGKAEIIADVSKKLKLTYQDFFVI